MPISMLMLLIPKLTAASGPTINNPNLKAELVFKGLKIPTSMAFLGPNNILVLRRIREMYLESWTVIL